MDVRGSLWCPTKAAAREIAGRARKSASPSARESLRTGPLTRTCRPTVGQKKVSAANGFAPRSLAFGPSSREAKIQPCSSTFLRMRTRAETRPSCPAVDRVIACGAWTPASTACSSHWTKRSLGCSGAASTSKAGSSRGKVKSDRRVVVRSWVMGVPFGRKPCATGITAERLHPSAEWRGETC